MERVGIRQRHIVDKGVATSDLAVEAAKKALAQRGIEASDLDAIIVGTVTPDMFFPSTACLVQHKLGREECLGIRCFGGLSAFVYALQAGAQFVAFRSAQESPRDRGGCDVVDHRLHRPRDLRHLWRWSGRRVARTSGRRFRWADRLYS